jgi:hypothetical protein
VSLSVYNAAERPDLEDVTVPARDIWPEYNMHGDVVNPNWGALWDELTEFQLFIVDDDSGAVVAELNTGPLWWDGVDESLSSGIDEAIVAAVEGHRRGVAANTLCAFSAKVAIGARGQGLALEGVKAMRALARTHGFGHFIAPVRPSFKARYPITPIEEYVTWRREDGLSFDPWIRVHERVGGRIARAIPESMRISGTVPEWESWTDMTFPVSGEYTFPDGLAPVRIDRDADLGVYYEPNVWIVHEL